MKKEMYRKSRPSRGSLNSIYFMIETKILCSSNETPINKLNVNQLNRSTLNILFGDMLAQPMVFSE